MGKHAAILPFKAVGVEIVDVKGVEEAQEKLCDLAGTEEETLVLIPEDIAVGCTAEIASIRKGSSIVVMTLPASSGNIGLQREQVRQLVARSIGVDLMGKK
jgi:ATP synthase (F/14-kDa) subunit.